MIHGKKAEDKPMGLTYEIVAIVVALLILVGWVVVKIFFVSNNFGPTIMQTAFDHCKQVSGNMVLDKTNDFDGDGLADCCDPCPLTPDGTVSGNQQDLIDFPDADQDHFQTYNNATPNNRGWGCLGNNGNIPRVNNDRAKQIDDVKYRQVMNAFYAKNKKFGEETPARDQNPSLTPIYLPTC